MYSAFDVHRLVNGSVRVRVRVRAVAWPGVVGRVGIGGLEDGSPPSGVQRQSPAGGLGAKPPEARYA